MWMEERLKQRPKAASPILVTLFGMWMDLRLLQSTNAPFPILVTLSGMWMEERLKQCPIAPSPIFVTLSGMWMEESCSHAPNALSHITLVPFLIVYFSHKLQSAFNNLFPSLLYFTPNSSFTAFFKSSLVTSVLNTSSSIGFSTPNNRNEHMERER